MMDIALIGPAGVGKDTVARLLTECFGYTRIAFADALKEALLHGNPKLNDHHRLAEFVASIGWDKAKEMPEVRRLLQEFGVAMRRIDSMIWVVAAQETVDATAGPIVLTDVRFPNEVAFARSLNALIVRLDRSGVDNKLGWRGHVSERALDDSDCDLVIDGDNWSPESAVDLILQAASDMQGSPC
jgi:cytidylate kinase